MGRGSGVVEMQYLVEQRAGKAGKGDRGGTARAVIVRGDREEFGWLRKNVYVNGVEDRAVLYGVRVGNHNRVSRGQ